jgi:drug/metabolite transporter (DMT)-like permease
MAFLPLGAVLLSALILGEPVRLLHMVAGACVLAGIMLASVAPSTNVENPCYGK